MHQGEAEEQDEAKEVPEPTTGNTPAPTSATRFREEEINGDAIESTTASAYSRPDVDGLVVPGEEAEDGIEDGPLGAVVVEDELVLLHVVRQLVVAHQLVLLALPAFSPSLLPLPPPLAPSSLRGRSRRLCRFLVVTKRGALLTLHGHDFSVLSLSHPVLLSVKLPRGKKKAWL